ncbi:hypothetical protein FIU95_21300 (plasmid) [Microbulbifer sp. THAF38]|nr:hypothetical protein FIU95_21300 [Microbulbifer sp. THAF38]
MVTAHTTTDQVTLSPNSFRLSLDLSMPGAFLAFYRKLVRNCKATRSRLLVRNAERLLNDY